VVPKLSGAWYAIRSKVHISNINTLKSIYYAYFHFVTRYGIVFWGTSSNSGNIFTLKKKSSELWLVYNPEPHAEVNLNN